MISLFHKLLRKNQIRYKLIIYFLLTTLIMGVTSMYTYYAARTFMLEIGKMFRNDIYLNELYQNVNNVEIYLENYLTTKHSDSLKEYIRYSSELKQRSDKIRKEPSSTESELLLKDIGNMINTYLMEADMAINSKRGRNINAYIGHYTEASKIAGYINLYINKLNIGQLQENTNKYLTVSGRLNFVQILNIFIIIGTIALNVLLAFFFTYRITKPIITLSRTADEISRGNFDVDHVNVDTDDEISTMAKAFNRMTSSIKTYIEEMKGKAELGEQLKEQEMQNLVMKNLLKDAELQALQSQINPHFIFNTLNAGVQIAMMEGADRTCSFMENMSNLFRYNIRKLDKPVTLRDEIDNVNNYIYILKERFADRVDFLQEINEDIVDVRMPCMILQPLVENAFIHGIGDMETGGKIKLRAYRGEARINVVIEDNGKGMDETTVKHLIKETYEAEGAQAKKGHTTGIGMSNVISRLKLFFNTEDIIDIYSSPGKGTKVVIRIPESFK